MKIKKLLGSDPINKYWLSATILYTGLVTFMSLKPAYHTAEPSTVKEVFFNTLHVPGYAGMAFFCYFCLRALVVVESAKLARYAFWTAWGWGFFMEILQIFAPGRGFSLIDLCSNAIGAGGVVWVINSKKGKI